MKITKFSVGDDMIIGILEALLKHELGDDGVLCKGNRIQNFNGGIAVRGYVYPCETFTRITKERYKYIKALFRVKEYLSSLDEEKDNGGKLIEEVICFDNIDEVK